MTSEELIAAAYKERPEYIEKVARTLSILGKYSPMFEEDLLEDIKTITNTVNQEIEKVAAFKPPPTPPSTGVGTAILVGGVSLLGAGLAAAVATDLYDAAKRGLTKATNFNRIMAANPDLVKHYDKRLLKNSFNALHRYAPEFTADPMIGGSILGSMAENPVNDVVMIKDLIQSRKALRDTKKSQFGMGQQLPFKVGPEHFA